MVLAVLAVVVGVGCLWRSADEFVTGATRLALLFNISPLVIGALVIGFGTSAPELLVSSLAAAGGDSDVGIGNIIGSNIANVSLILGAASLILPIAVSGNVLKREAPLSVLGVVLFAIAIQFPLTRLTGVLLLAALAFALYALVRGGGSTEDVSTEVMELAGEGEHSPSVEAFRTLVGMTITVAGAWVLVWGALGIADELGVSGGFIGVSVVAVGTSLPELVTAIAAARAQQPDLIVGNLLGSNIFNSLAVGGAVALIGPGPLADASLSTLDTGIMLVVVLGADLAMRTRPGFSRVEGMVLISVYFAFIAATTVAEQETIDEQSFGTSLVEFRG